MPNAAGDPFHKLVAALEARKDPDPRWESVVFDGTNHLTGVVGALARAMRSLYAPSLTATR